MSIHTIARFIGALIAAAVAAFILFFEHAAAGLADRFSTGPASAIAWGIGIIVGCAIIAFIITPYVTIVPYRWISHQIRSLAVSDLIAGTIGLIVGLFIAVLAGIPLGMLPGDWGHILPVIAAIACGYLGITAAVARGSELGHMMQNLFSGRRREREREEEREKEKNKEREGEENGQKTIANQILLDTSAIIDGRIADISQTGFIAGTLVVPRFVLNELQRIADSADTMRRNRGRRGLDMLNRLQKDTNVPVEIVDTDIENIAEVDSKLVKMARMNHCPIITNDFNLNRVAELQGVKVLNINELANAVKPVLLPGEDIHIKIMQDGKELGQGVGYLDDGTMIVVEGGRQYMNMTIEVTVTRVLQTVAGRMIFAHPKQGSNNTVSSQSTSKQRQS